MEVPPLAGVPPSYHQLAKAASFAVHLEDVTALCQAGRQRGHHSLALEDRLALARHEVARQQQATASIASADAIVVDE